MLIYNIFSTVCWGSNGRISSKVKMGVEVHSKLLKIKRLGSHLDQKVRLVLRIHGGKKKWSRCKSYNGEKLEKCIKKKRLWGIVDDVLFRHF